jgi:hypothetical protein
MSGKSFTRTPGFHNDVQSHHLLTHTPGFEDHGVIDRCGHAHLCDLRRRQSAKFV